MYYLLQQADELAPLFSGAAWAGTLLWDAAVHLARRFLADYRQQLEDPTNSCVSSNSAPECALVGSFAGNEKYH